MPQKGADGSYGWALPMSDKRLAGIAAEDIEVVIGIFKAGKTYVGRTVGIASEFLTIPEMSDKLVARQRPGGHRASRRLGRATTVGFGFPGADEMGEHDAGVTATSSQEGRS